MDHYPAGIVDTDVLAPNDYYFKEDGSEDFFISNIGVGGQISIVSNHQSMIFKNVADFNKFVEDNKFYRYTPSRMYLHHNVQKGYHESCYCDGHAINEKKFDAKYVRRHPKAVKYRMQLAEFAKFIDSHPGMSAQEYYSEFVKDFPEVRNARRIFLDFATARTGKSESVWVQPNSFLKDRSGDFWNVSDVIGNEYVIAEKFESGKMSMADKLHINKARPFIRGLNLMPGVTERPAEEVVADFLKKTPEAKPYKDFFVDYLKRKFTQETRTFNRTRFQETFGRTIALTSERPWSTGDRILVNFDGDLEKGLWEECEVLETDGYTIKTQRPDGSLQTIRPEDLYPVPEKFCGEGEIRRLYRKA